MSRPCATRRRPSALLLTTLVLSAGCSDRPPAGSSPAGPAHVPAADFSLQPSAAQPSDLHVVNLTAGIPADFGQRVAALGGSVLRSHPEIGVVVAQGLSDAAAAWLARDPAVTGLERDRLVQWIPAEATFETLEAPRAETDQSGAFFFSTFQWNMRQIDADEAWLVTNQGQGARVAILDSGIDPGHLDTNGKVDAARSASFLTPGSSPCGAADEGAFLDMRFHGTMVAALVASNGIGMASVAPDATLIAVKVLNCGGTGFFSDIIAGILHAVSVDADVINMSLGAVFPVQSRGTGQLLAALDRATNFAHRNGVLVVASAGNEALNLDRVRNFVHVPSQSANVLSAGATAPIGQQNFDDLASYTNFGVTGVDLMAPGGDFVAGSVLQDLILSACSRFSVFFNCAAGNVYLRGGGTSFAAPHVAGAAAVVASQLPGGQKAATLGHCVTRGADDLGRPGTDDQYGKGRVNVVGAVNAPGC